MTIRSERDSMGEVSVPADRYWGAQTQRSLMNFPIGDRRMPPSIIVALATIKKAAARCNQRLDRLPRELADAIERAADEVIDRSLDEHFPLVVWQTGSGTQTNMNVNEVIANRAIELLGGEIGSRSPVHPNDHVNMSQSSNDVFPTAMSMAIVTAVEDQLLPVLADLTEGFAERARRFRDVVKIGRTHLMDATPLTVGDELESFVAQLEHARRAIGATLPAAREIPIGGTAVGTGLNAPSGWDTMMSRELSALTGKELVVASSKLAAQAAHDAIVSLHGAVRVAACALMKIANDVRWLASGPRGGLGELRIPENEPGSSIMPGKVNPTQCEALLMVCARVLGNDTTIGIAGASGDLQLNVFKPLIAATAIESIELLADAARSFDLRLVRGLELNEDSIRRHLERSLMLVTALAPHIGYDRAAEVAKRALREDKTLREVAVAMGLCTEEAYEKLVDPARMANVAERDP